MTYITVYNLSINSNYRILAEELNYRFTKIGSRFFELEQFMALWDGVGNLIKSSNSTTLHTAFMFALKKKAVSDLECNNNLRCCIGIVPH